MTAPLWTYGAMCNVTYPVQPICTFSCTSVFILIFINPQYTVLHILSHCTSYSFYFIICSLFILTYIYIYIFSCVMFHCFIAFFVVVFFIFYFFCTFHWADLSWLTFHYWLYPVLCMWQIIKNLEPIWTPASCKVNSPNSTGFAIISHLECFPCPWKGSVLENCVFFFVSLYNYALCF